MQKSHFSSRALLLIAVDAMGGKVNGRTLLQKRLFFLAEFLDEDLEFKSHFYGPYSSLIHGEVMQAIQLGLLSEDSSVDSPFLGERTRMDCALTVAGKHTVARFEARDPEGAKLIRREVDRLMDASGSLDGAEMSVAAKIYYILKIRGLSEMAMSQVTEEAKEFRWNLPQEKLVDAAKSLVALGLVDILDTSK